MALSRALVDRARRLEREAAAQKVEGTTHFIETTGPWFKARLTHMNVDPETNDPARARVQRRPILTFGLKAENGGEAVLHADDRVEIESTELGHAIYHVQGEPQPLRRRKRMLGWLAQLEQVEER